MDASVRRAGGASWGVLVSAPGVPLQPSELFPWVTVLVMLNGTVCADCFGRQVQQVGAGPWRCVDCGGERWVKR